MLSGEGMQRRVEHTIEDSNDASNRLRRAAQARDRLRDTDAAARSGPAAGPRPASCAHRRLGAGTEASFQRLGLGRSLSMP